MNIKAFQSAFSKSVKLLNRRECKDCGTKFTPLDPTHWRCDEFFAIKQEVQDELRFMDEFDFRDDR